MDLTSWTGPIGLFLVGSVCLIGVLCRRAASGNGEDWTETLNRLETEKRELARLLDEARRTARHLERMIDSFDKTFYSDQPEDCSVAGTMAGLNDQLRLETQKLSERLQYGGKKRSHVSAFDK